MKILGWYGHLRQPEQREDEPITDFGIRVQGLEQRLLAVYEAAIRTSETEHKHHCEREREEALEAFLCKIHDPPEYRLMAKEPKTLREAISCATYLKKS